MTVAEPTPAASDRTADALVGRLFQASIGAMEILSVYIGDRLGLYRSLHEGGPATAQALASRTGVNARYAREWLEQQAVADLLDVEDASAPPDERRYALPEGYASALLDLDSPLSIAPLSRAVASIGTVM